MPPTPCARTATQLWGAAGDQAPREPPDAAGLASLLRGRTNALNSYTEKDPFAYAFYSSLTNAVTTDPTMMIVPIDDHQFVHGHALFESVEHFFV